MEASIYTTRLKTMSLKVREAESIGKCGNHHEAYGIARSIYDGLDDDQEHFSVLFLDTQNNVTGYKVISSGKMSSTLIDMKILFRNVLLFGASGIICIHNHPANNRMPSVEDIAITVNIYNAGQLLEIAVLDHIILTRNDHYSMQAQGDFARFETKKQRKDIEYQDVSAL